MSENNKNDFRDILDLTAGIIMLIILGLLTVGPLLPTLLTSH